LSQSDKDKRFAESLSADQLSFATNVVARKVHVARLRRSAYEIDVDGVDARLSKAKRVKIIAEIDPDRRRLWSATALCGVTGEQAVYGDVKRYYWRPVRGRSLEEICAGCLREWRKLGEPEIAGWDRGGDADGAWPWALPFGWRAVPAVGHPWDVPAGQPTEDVKNDAGNVVGERRVEIWRWARGPRVVRLVHYTDADVYSARYWLVDADPGADKQEYRGTLALARQRCQQLMARGGY